MKKAQGFTLIELVLVVALLGTLVTLAIPRFTGVLDENSLHGAAQELAAEIRYAQTMALAQGCRYLVEFEEDQRKFNLYSSRNNGFQLVKTKTLTPGVSYDKITFSKPAGLSWRGAGFTGNGNPSSGGTVTLQNRQGEQVEITVMLATGRVLVKE